MEFRDKVVKIREILLISQETLAMELDVSFATINRLENGHTKPSLITRARFESLCKKKGINFDDGGYRQ